MQRLNVDYPLIHWLLTGARRITEPKAFLSALADQLAAHGIEVSRLVSGVPILHPQVHSYSARWDRGMGVSERFFRLTAETMNVLENSPVKTVYQGGGSVRCNPTAPPVEGEFNILADLRREGITDYIALSIPFSDGAAKLLAVATQKPGGFSDEQVEILEAMVPGIAVNLEIQAMRLTARTLLDTYVGRQAGARVLEGAIKRGMGETIRAVIWFCDLRGFQLVGTTAARHPHRSSKSVLRPHLFGARRPWRRGFEVHRGRATRNLSGSTRRAARGVRPRDRGRGKRTRGAQRGQ
jgi:adenylate cyclase